MEWGKEIWKIQQLLQRGKSLQMRAITESSMLDIGWDWSSNVCLVDSGYYSKVSQAEFLGTKEMNVSPLWKFKVGVLALFWILFTSGLKITTSPPILRWQEKGERAFWVGFPQVYFWDCNLECNLVTSFSLPFLSSNSSQIPLPTLLQVHPFPKTIVIFARVYLYIRIYF